MCIPESGTFMLEEQCSTAKSYNNTTTDMHALPSSSVIHIVAWVVSREIPSTAVVDRMNAKHSLSCSSSLSLMIDTSTHITVVPSVKVRVSLELV